MFAFKLKYNSKHVLDLENGSYPDSTFNTFLEGFVTVFIVLANDGWTTIYLNLYRTVGSGISTIYVISLLLMGQFILLNLFLAILLDNFDESSLG